MGDAKNLEELLQQLASSEEEAREEAASALVGTDDPRALMPLMAAAKDPHPGVKYFAKKALKGLQEKIAEKTGIADDEPAPAAEPPAKKPVEKPAEKPAEKSAPQKPAPAAPPAPPAEEGALSFDEMFAAMMTEPAAPPPPPAPAAKAAATAATAQEPAEVEPPPAAKSAPVPEKNIADDVREKIAKIQEIAETGNHAKLPALLKLLESESDKFLLATLVKAVGALGDKSHMDPLLPFLADDDPRVAANTVEALERLGNPKCVEQVIKLISHPDNRVRANAMKTVWHYAHNNALANKLIMDRLKEMIFSSKPQMRESAIYVLGEIGSEAALDIVALSANDSIESVRTKAQEAIAKIEAKLAEAPTAAARLGRGAARAKPGMTAPKETPAAEEGAEAPAGAEESRPAPAAKAAKPATKAVEKPTAAKPSVRGGDDEPVVDIDKSRAGAKATITVGVSQSAANRNPMQTVMKISVAISLVVALAAGGLVWYTGGDLNQIGIPYELFPKIDAPKTGGEETLGMKTGFDQRMKDGRNYLEEGFYEEAIKEFTMALREKPDHPEAKKGIAEARFKRGEEYTNLEIFDRALEEFKDVLKWTPSGEFAGKAEERIKRLNERLR